MKKILIADDSLFMRTVIKDLLRGKYEVLEADSGEACLEQFDRSRPDLTLLDVVMPDSEEEGLKVLRSIMDRAPDAKVVMITALGGEDSVVKDCLALGAKGCILKPFDDAKILSTIQECLG